MGFWILHLDMGLRSCLFPHGTWVWPWLPEALLGITSILPFFAIL